MIAFRLAASLIVGLFVGLLAVFGLRFLTVWMNGNGIWSAFLPVALAALMASIGYLAGEISEGAPVAIPLAIVLVVLCEVSWYWWDFREFRIALAKVEYTGSNRQVLMDGDAFLTSEVGVSGF